MGRTEDRIRDRPDFPLARLVPSIPEPLARSLAPLTRYLDYFPSAPSPRQEASRSAPELTQRSGGKIDSPLDYTGPIPEELRKDSFVTDSIPWSIREAEIEKDRVRVQMVWMTAAIVSWVVALVAIIRLL